MKKLLTLIGMLVAPLALTMVLPHLAVILIILLATPPGSPLFPAAVLLGFGLLSLLSSFAAAA
ncbi:MAG TPA: hypothetical protein VNM72_06980 [Blastocatellia bacterium]|nr:hypothetical protein [Blastocatellia bacterium]